MAELVRVAALSGFFPTMQAFGADPAPLLKEAGLSPRMLDNAEQMIPARPAMRLLERGAEVTGCATFGLRMAESRGIANLGATSLLIAHQPTLRAALSALALYRNRINSTLVLLLDDFGDSILIREDFSLDLPEASRQASDLAIGVLAGLCKSVLGDDWHAESVCFTHGAPPVIEMPIYRRLFGCRPEFNSEFNGIIIHPRDLDRPNQRADPALAEHARMLIETVMSPERHSVAQQVEQSILLLLPAGFANIQMCGDLLGQTVRTLQRNLDAEGASFSALLNKARLQLATKYLSNRRNRITDVAEMLGYRSIGAFTRWYVQSFGETPSKRRGANL
ncbi:MAG: AraC family transcriptional regulator [Sphingopyxis sp.]